MPQVRIASEARTEFGKGAARRVRRAHKVPAVVYGHGEDPKHVALPGHDLMLALKRPNVLIELEMAGGTQLVLPRDVQRHPTKGFLEHVDLVVVRSGEKVQVDVPVHLVGEAERGAVVTLEHPTLSIGTDPTNIPNALEVSVADLPPGTHIVASQIELPAGAELVTSGDALVVNITHAPAAELPTVEAGLEEESEAALADAGQEGAAGGDGAAGAEE